MFRVLRWWSCGTGEGTSITIGVLGRSNVDGHSRMWRRRSYACVSPGDCYPSRLHLETANLYPWCANWNGGCSRKPTVTLTHVLLTIARSTPIMLFTRLSWTDPQHCGSSVLIHTDSLLLLQGWLAPSPSSSLA
ncbi:uncharacterized protein LOC144753122 [Lissotriton helveticus]